MGYITPDTISRAKEMDLLTYLQTFEPNNLVHLGGENYCTREHDSLKISNGKWHWFSRGFGGRTALDYLIKVEGYTFTDAVEVLTGRAAMMPPVFHTPKPEPSKAFTMPETTADTHRVREYLMGRGIHPDIINYCMENKLLFETRKYHNALFAGYDTSGKIRYGALRGTVGDFKGEVPGSDKHYSFAIPPDAVTGRLHLFEAAIDAMSYATLLRIKGRDWRRDGLLSLAGVYKNRQQIVLPMALEQYLKDHPEVRELHLHLDNDVVGREAAAGISHGFQDRFKVLNEPPPCGKDVNELLQRRLGIFHGKEEMTL